ncbi:MAG: phosphoribosylaminoimidazolesuccinocarboxamide synthase [Planctomycetia bacterium]|nr:phosphoribosylaminoimidazolesuccinocarboxamide synthase [Planctomycetia bacterium]
MSKNVVLETSLDMPVHHGKVRDIYDMGENLLLVSSDRISAFDWILPSGIPDKGRVLTQLAAFWFQKLGEKNHFLTADVNEIPFPFTLDTETRQMLEGRVTYCKKTKVIPIECVVRGYLVGSGWNEYKKSGTVCGISLPEGLKESAKLETPIFTPSTKAEEGHDENISFQQTVEIIGEKLACELRERSISLFLRGSEYALERGIIIADTKFEWGILNDEVILIDEVLTPDSSRFWPADLYEEGKSQPSYDKQFVRDWLLASSWDKNSTPPELPEEIIKKTREKYIEAYERLTETPFPWK